MRRFLSVSIAASLVALVLTGCMVPQWQKPGMPQAEVEKGMGKPTVVVPLADGGTRLIYCQQPAAGRSAGLPHGL